MEARKTLAVGLVAAVVASLGLLLALGTAQAQSASGCKRVSGHLLDEHVERGTAVGQMVGGIRGHYEITEGSLVSPDPNAPGEVVFASSNTTINTQRGDLFWHESNAFDVSNQDKFNNAILATVTGGTGAWVGARGHVILWGYWNTTSDNGALEYEGEICTN